jgi:hypothetical protein
MRRLMWLAIMLCVCGLAMAAGAQDVTTEMMGPLSGGLTVSIPAGNPNCPAAGQQDSVTITRGHDRKHGRLPHQRSER